MYTLLLRDLNSQGIFTPPLELVLVKRARLKRGGLAAAFDVVFGRGCLVVGRENPCLAYS